MHFPFNLYLAAFALATLASLLSLPLWRAACHRWGLVDDPGHRKIHHTPVPLAGGFAVLTGLLTPLLGCVLALYFKWLDFATGGHALGYGLERRGLEVAAIG